MINNKFIEDIKETNNRNHKCLPRGVCYEGYTISLGMYSVGPGWASLIDKAFRAIEDADPPVKIFQIKEKWGGLRIYTNVMNKKVDKKLLEIMKKSYYICEDCGNPGNLRAGERMKTLCDKHANGREIIEDI
jgi:hypothetical protein